MRETYWMKPILVTVVQYTGDNREEIFALSADIEEIEDGYLTTNEGECFPLEVGYYVVTHPDVGTTVITGDLLKEYYERNRDNGSFHVFVR